ncbi:MAG: rhodanese-like domain-containing protein [Planctomycetota bacterium]
MRVPLDRFLVGPEACESSTAAEAIDWIVSTAQNVGATAEPIAGWTLTDLERIVSPTIVLLKKNPGAPEADHSVLLLGFDDDGGRVHVGRSEPVVIPHADWTELWLGDGVMLAPAGEPPPDADLRPKRVARLHLTMIAAAGAALTIGLARVIRWNSGEAPRRRSATRLVGETCLLLGLTGAASALSYTVGWATAADRSVLSARRSGEVSVNLAADEPVRRAEFTDVDDHQLRLLLTQQPTPVFIDARDLQAFNARRVEGSIGLFSFDLSSTRLATSGVPRDVPLIVYCYYEDCPRGRLACGALNRVGFTNLYHYPPGWEGLRSFAGIGYEFGPAVGAGE